MRISDWSSDVCSSDLQFRLRARQDKHSISMGYVLAERTGFETEVPSSIAATKSRKSQEIFRPSRRRRTRARDSALRTALADIDRVRSEERRVGKEGVSPSSSRWWPDH